MPLKTVVRLTNENHPTCLALYALHPLVKWYI